MNPDQIQEEKPLQSAQATPHEGGKHLVGSRAEAEGSALPQALATDPAPREPFLFPSLQRNDVSEFSFRPVVSRFDSDAENAYILFKNRGVTPQPPRDAPESQDFGSKMPNDPAKQAAYLEFWSTHLHWKSSVAAKLRAVGETGLADDLDHCRSEASVLRCTGCGKQRVFYNRCDQKHCPACSPRLSRERKQSVEEWALYIGQPKHVVLTCKNTGALTEAMVLEFKAAFTRLRRSKFATEHTDEIIAIDIATRKPIHRYSYPWLGGFYSLEVTKEANGWHLHLHALIDSRYIDCVSLSDAWARALRAPMAIVKVKDARAKDYLAEVCKYVVKGDQMAAMPGADIATLIHAFEHVRTFGVFGTLYKRRSEFSQWLAQQQLEPEACECGCRRWEILTDKEAEWKEQTSGAGPPSSGRAAREMVQVFLAVQENRSAIQALAR